MTDRSTSDPRMVRRPTDDLQRTRAAPPAAEFDPMEVLGGPAAKREIRKPPIPGKISTEPELMACPQCGEELLRDATRCTRCGLQLRRVAQREPIAAAKFVCADCYSLTDGQTIVQGNLVYEIALWLCGLLPGLLYSLWRLTTKRRGCTKCGGASLVPADAPRGRELVERLAVR